MAAADLEGQMRLFRRRQSKDDASGEIAAVLQGEQLAIADFSSIGDIARRLMDDTWSQPFMDRDERHRLMAEFPDPDREFEVFLIATRADRRNAEKIKDAWYSVWLRGYFLGLARLHRENEELGRTPAHVWRSPAANEYFETWTRLGALAVGDDVDRIERELGWMGYGALAPFSARVMYGALAFISAQEDDNFLRHYEAGEPRLRALMMLRRVAGEGYALARAQQETALMVRFLEANAHA